MDWILVFEEFVPMPKVFADKPGEGLSHNGRAENRQGCIQRRPRMAVVMIRP